MAKRRIFKVLVVLLLLLIAAAGGLILARPKVIDQQRQDVEQELITRIERGETNISGLILPKVEGEEPEFVELPEFPEVSNSADAASVEELEAPDTEEVPIEIIGYGLLEIPSIDLKMAVVQGADSYSIRAAAGWLPESAQIGGPGNCVIFGHRMRDYGRHFNRLDELSEGDSIILTDASGDRYTYTVTGSEVIWPESLMPTLRAHSEGFGLTLVTCTPVAVCTQRLLVYAVLDTTKEYEVES